MEIRRLQLLVILSFVVGVFFRFIGLGSLMYSHDEAYTSLRAAGYTGSEAIDSIWDGRIITRDAIQYFVKPIGDKDVFDTISVIARSEPQLSPLYFIFAHYWMRLIGSSPVAMRGLSALFSLFAIPGMYWLSMELFRSRRVALVSTALISLSPFIFLLANDARPYSLWASLTLLSSAALMAAIRKNKMFDWVVYSFFVVLGLYTHLMFALVIIAHGLYIVVFKEFRLGKRIIQYLIASFFALVTFIPWLYQLITRWNFVMGRIDSTDTQISILHIQHWVTTFASPFIDLYFGQRNVIPYILRVPVLLLIGYGLVFLFVRTPKRIWVFLLLLIGVSTLPFMLSDILRGGVLSIQGRYFASTNVAIILIIAYLLVEKMSESREKPPYIWYLITVLLVVAQIGSTLNILMAETWWTKKISWIDPQIGHVLNQENHPLLVVNGLWPTDLGDVLSISYMVDQDVSFILFQTPKIEKLPGGFSNIYWFHKTYGNYLDSENGKKYQATEVVPYFLWRVDDK